MVTIGVWRASRGHSVIELTLATALGSLVLAAALAFHMQQRDTWRVAFETAGGLARTGEALRILTLAARGAVVTRVANADGAGGHRLVLQYPRSGQRQSEQDDLVRACSGRVDPEASADGYRLSDRVQRVATHWFARVHEREVSSTGGTLEAAEARAIPEARPIHDAVRGELHCAQGEHGYASPMVDGIGALYAMSRPMKGRDEPRMASTVDLCVTPVRTRSAGDRARLRDTLPIAPLATKASCPDSLGLSTRVAQRSRVIELNDGRVDRYLLRLHNAD